MSCKYLAGCGGGLLGGKRQVATGNHLLLEEIGAALQNRAYDAEGDDGHRSLERALTALLSVPSLVGPLSVDKIKFLTTWLSLAYWSKSTKLGFGIDSSR